MDEEILERRTVRDSMPNKKIKIDKKAARSLGKYVDRLVRNMPPWVKKLFEDDLMKFSVEDDFSIFLCVAEDLPELTKQKATLRVQNYMKRLPCPLLTEQEIQ